MVQRISYASMLLFAAIPWCGSIIAAGENVSMPSSGWMWMEARPEEHCTRYFRYAFELPGRVKAAPVWFAVDDLGTIYVNGTLLTSRQGIPPKKYELAKLLRPGRNVIAVKAENRIGLAGVIFRGRAVLENGGVFPLISSRDMRCSREASGDWTGGGYDDREWKRTFRLGPAAMKPWGSLVDTGPLQGGRGGPGGTALFLVLA